MTLEVDQIKYQLRNITHREQGDKRAPILLGWKAETKEECADAKVLLRLELQVLREGDPLEGMSRLLQSDRVLQCQTGTQRMLEGAGRVGQKGRDVEGGHQILRRFMVLREVAFSTSYRIRR